MYRMENTSRRKFECLMESNTWIRESMADPGNSELLRVEITQQMTA